MPITSFTYITIGPPNNRRVVFTAVPHVGNSFEYTVHTVDPLWDPENVKTAIQAKLEERLGEREVAQWMADTEAPVTTVHATKAQYAAAIRAAYKDATKEEAWRLAYKIYSRYQAGDFTAQQLATAFQITVGQLNTFATNKLIPAHDAWIVLQAAEGG